MDTTTTTTYTEVGVRTPAGAYWLLVLVLAVGMPTAAFFAARTGNYVTAFVAAAWMVGAAAGTIRSLRRLVEIQTYDDAARANAASRLAFEVTLALIVSVVSMATVLL